MLKLLQRRSWGAASLVLSLAACGGGGGGDGGITPPQASPKLAISSANYQQVSSAAVSGAMFLQDSGSLVGGGPRIRAMAPLQQSAGLVRRAMSVAATVRPASSVQTSLACSLGGQLQFTLTDANGDNQLNAGDSLVIEAQACREVDSTVSGRLTLNVASATGVFGSSSYSLSLQMSMVDFSVVSQGGTTVGRGSITLSLSQQATGAADLALDTVELNVTHTVAGTPSSETLSNTHLAVHIEPSGRSSLTFGGSLKSSGFDNKLVDISTPTPWVQLPGDRYPSSGQLLIRGDAGSQVRVTVLNRSQVQLELDANGDGVFETSVIKAWTELT